MWDLSLIDVLQLHKREHEEAKREDGWFDTFFPENHFRPYKKISAMGLRVEQFDEFVHPMLEGIDSQIHLMSLEETERGRANFVDNYAMDLYTPEEAVSQRNAFWETHTEYCVELEEADTKNAAFLAELEWMGSS
ncbi:hypothetical protein HYALB_00010151 [Hymenoscyphus albidus]|uniref:Uncharacterized protein n=1 Tax=Hymenoscyphus albidus TaxID=595503 RepID=A0A9N9QCC7_9HELO|nr:hypothetical protein HYALB_00010151 [Hymenoscyphus albidus]